MATLLLGGRCGRRAPERLAVEVANEQLTGAQHVLAHGPHCCGRAARLQRRDDLSVLFGVQRDGVLLARQAAPRVVLWEPGPGLADELREHRAPAGFLNQTVEAVVWLAQALMEQSLVPHVAVLG